MKTNRFKRRTMIKTLAAAAGAWTVLPDTARCTTTEAPVWPQYIISFLATLARPGGGYAWDEQSEPHLTATYAVIGCHRLLGKEMPNKKAVAEFVRTHHPAELKKLEQIHHEFEFQQIQSLIWLGEDVSSFREQVAGWKKPYVYFKQYEQHGNPIFRFELAAFTCRELLGMPLDDLAAELVPYLEARRRANGSFNGTVATDGSDGHVLNTWWGLNALRILGRDGEKKDEAIAWLRKCQMGTGGFTYQPDAPFAKVDDVAYTWAATRALKQLGSVPTDRSACLKRIQSLWQGGGGFSDQPGWARNPMATFYALGALEALGATAEFTAWTGTPMRGIVLPHTPELKVFTVQIEAHGNGSPAEAVDLARSLRIHLWGAKNSPAGWIARAQEIANQRRVPVTFFTANEEYGTWVSVPGLGTYSHTADSVAPAGVDFGESTAKAGPMPWAEYRERRLAPLQKAGGCLIWQFGENEELVRLYLDDSIQRGAYAGISTFHFGNPDFTNTEPFLNRYRYQIPFVGLQDAHGPEPWWFSDMTTGFRTLFLGTEPTYEAWMSALRKNWVAAVRHDAVSGGQTWMHYGPKEVMDHALKHDRDWRWWDNPEIARPMVSILAIKPGDPFEAGRPEKGVAIRVRCAWENTTGGLPKKPITELVRLTVDGAEVSPTLVAPKKGGAGFQDHYHIFQVPDPSPGKHVATAVIRAIDTKAESQRVIEFTV